MMFSHDFPPHHEFAHLRHYARPPLRGRVLPLALAFGALAVGAGAIGALAIGKLAIGRAVIGKARIRELEIDDLVIRKIARPEDHAHGPSGNGEG